MSFSGTLNPGSWESCPHISRLFHTNLLLGPQVQHAQGPFRGVFSQFWPVHVIMVVQRLLPRIAHFHPKRGQCLPVLTMPLRGPSYWPRAAGEEGQVLTRVSLFGGVRLR